MRRHPCLWLAAAIALAPRGAAAETSSWIFRPSCYSHSPQTGERVAQYQPEEPALAPYDETYQQSGYRYFRSSLQFGQGEDHAHLVQTWGAPIRPYGEWEYPFRAGATPFGPWGNPQGPWTLPFDSWQNPFALGRLGGGGQGGWQGGGRPGPWPPGPWAQQQFAPQVPAPGGPMSGQGGGQAPAQGGGPMQGQGGTVGGQPPTPPVSPAPSP
jgi:hypothetical protein